MNPRAPWRRAARPLAVLFAVQLSGVGCAARAPVIQAPTKPDELGPYLTVYQDQLEDAGITLDEAEDYLAGRATLPRRTNDGNGPSVPETDRDVVGVAPGGQGSNETFKLVNGVPEYLIGSGDVIRTTTYLGPELPTSASFRVQADGTIYISRFNIGAVQASGSTPTELTRTLSELYRRYVPSGYVEIRVEEYNAWHALLTGEIVDIVGDGPGNYPLDGRVTVSDFIYTHGGPTQNAALGDVRVLRQGTEITVDVAGILAGRVEDAALRSGDIVHVPSIQQGDSIMVILGEVTSPGVYALSQGTSVLDAIAQAGGWTATAKRDAVYVSRPSTGEVIPVNVDTILGDGQAATATEIRAGDFVVVPFTPDRSQRIRDWVGVVGLILSALTIFELIRRD